MIRFYDNKTTKEDIQKYFIEIADCFLPPLYMYVDINIYAEKIRRFAYTGEAWFENRLIGLIACYLNNKDTHEAFITHLSVHTQFCNRGIASHLISGGLIPRPSGA
jgi:ribosomal-protein-alanine N-acetyltransferase